MKHAAAWVSALVFVSLLALGLVGACGAGDEVAPGRGGGSTVPDAGGGGGGGGEGSDACVPKTCAQLGAECGTAPDECGGIVECGTCSGGDHCGGGGKNKCGTDPCTPKSCVQVDASCGYASDGCATAIDCGSCAAPQTCGGAGTPNQCGCGPKTCAELGAECGSAPDGCGGEVSCGSCPSGETCGGGGQNLCGTGQCNPKSCAQLDASCGIVSDTCSQIIDCGSCAAPQTCGGGGVQNQCGCTPQTCVSLSLSCGMAPSGCGVTLDCGSCVVANATATCNAGTCQLGSCDPGFANCDGDLFNGCETNIQADPDHCGNCMTMCTAPSGTPVCNSGVCGVSNCAVGTADCDGIGPTGCETDTTTSASHCGFCDNPCTYANANGVCVASTCQLDACNAGFGNCDGIDSNGCETPLDTVLNCGTCIVNCTSFPANSTGTACVSGQCAITSCDPGFTDPNAVYADGCECGADAIPDTCGSAIIEVPDPVPLGGVGMDGPYTILPAGDEDWFAINFAGSADCAYHPMIALNDPSGVLRLDVTFDCVSGITCGEGGDSTGVTSWEFTYADVCGPSQPIDPPKAPAPSTVRVRVYATSTPGPCLTYTLSFSN